MHTIRLFILAATALVHSASAAYAVGPSSAPASVQSQSDYYEQPAVDSQANAATYTPPQVSNVASSANSGSAYPMQPPSSGAVNNFRPPAPAPAPAAVIRDSNTNAYRPTQAAVVSIRPTPVVASVKEIPCDHTMTMPVIASVREVRSTVHKTHTRTVTLAARPTTVYRTILPSVVAVRPTPAAVEASSTDCSTSGALPTAESAPTYGSTPNVASAPASYVAPLPSAQSATNPDCPDSTSGNNAGVRDVPDTNSGDTIDEGDTGDNSDNSSDFPDWPDFGGDRGHRGHRKHWPGFSREDEPSDNYDDEEPPLGEEIPDCDPTDPSCELYQDPNGDETIPDCDPETDANCEPLDPTDPSNDPTDPNGDPIPAEPADPVDPTDPTEDPVDGEPFPPFEDVPEPASNSQDNSQLVRRATTTAPKKDFGIPAFREDIPAAAPVKPVLPPPCVTNTFKCSGRAGFQKCDHGKWFNFKCAPGTVCKNNVPTKGLILCDWA